MYVCYIDTPHWNCTGRSNPSKLPQITKSMGPTWGPHGFLSAPDGLHVGPKNLAIMDGVGFVSSETDLCSAAIFALLYAIPWHVGPLYNDTCFYPRPVLASGYCHCPCPSVRHQVCPCDNSSPVQARITKFEPKMHNTLVKVPIVLGGNQLWPSRSNLRSK